MEIQDLLTSYGWYYGGFMPKLAKTLTVLEVAKLSKQIGLHSVGGKDSPGLYLQVSSCVFRDDPASDFGMSRPPISVSSGH